MITPFFRCFMIILLSIFGFLQPLRPNNFEVLELFNQKLKLDPEAIEGLNFGLTNQNFRVAVDGQFYFIRIGTNLPDLLCIERDSEEKFYKIAQELSLTPDLLYCDINRGIIITPFVQAAKFGKIMGNWTGEPKEVIACIVKTLKRIHSFKAPDSDLIPYPLRILDSYYRIGKELGANFPAELSQAVVLAKSLDIPFGERVLCHHDLFWTNVLYDGNKVWVVDWEYADWDDPLYDLAGFCIKQGLNAAEREIALEEYIPGFQNNDRIKFDKMCRLCALNTSMWCFIQKKIHPDSEIDIEAIGKKHLTAFWQLASPM